MFKPDDPDLRAILRTHMAENGLNVTSWSKAAQMPESTLRNFLAGRSETITYATLVALAKAIGQNVTNLIYVGSEKSDLIHVLHESNAHQWRGQNFAEKEARFWINVPKDPRYPGVQKTGVLVGDESINLVYPAGTVLVCVRYEDTKREPAIGDKVLCIESSYSNDKEEWPDLERTSIRELVKDGHDTWLMLRSSSPSYSEHIKLDKPLHPPADIIPPAAFCVNEQSYVMLEGVVISSFRFE